MTAYPTPMEIGVQKAENDWKQNHKLTPELTEIITEILTQGNPYTNLVLAMPMCWEFSKAKGGQTLCHQFLYVLKEMRDRNEECVSDIHLTDAIRRRIVYIVLKQMNNTLFETVCKIFVVTRENAEIYDPLAVELLQGNLINEATRLVIQIGLRDEFADRLAMPLLLFDRLQLLATLLEGLPEVQERVLKIFDDHYEDAGKVRLIVQRHDITSIKKVDRVLWKKMCKLMTRYLKKYNLPPDTCPNLQLSRNRSAMRYLLQKRYLDKDMAENSWREMAMDLVMDYQALHYELMRALFNHNDMKCAHYFALKLDFPREEWPATFVKYVEGLPPGASPFDELENNNGPSNYLSVELRSDQIQLICDASEFETAAAQLAAAPLIGVDAEWKPAMGLLQKTRLSLIQMATREKVYLFDVLKLSEVVTQEEWADFHKRVFNNPTGCILGFGIAEDLRKLEALSGAPIFMTYIKDLIIVRDALLSHRPELMESVVDLKVLKNHNGLSKLTCRLLGYPLDKSEQCSDWENRPLRESQVHYAALDAHCLIRCWDELDRRCGDEDIRLVIEEAIRYRKEQADSSTGKPNEAGYRANRKGRKHGDAPGQVDHHNVVSSLGIGYQKKHPGFQTPSLPESGYSRNTRRWDDRASSSASGTGSGNPRNVGKTNAWRCPTYSASETRNGGPRNFEKTEEWRRPTFSASESRNGGPKNFGKRDEWRCRTSPVSETRNRSQRGIDETNALRCPTYAASETRNEGPRNFEKTEEWRCPTSPVSETRNRSQRNTDETERWRIRRTPASNDRFSRSAWNSGREETMQRNIISSSDRTRRTVMQGNPSYERRGIDTNASPRFAARQLQRSQWRRDTTSNDPKGVASNDRQDFP